MNYCCLEIIQYQFTERLDSENIARNVSVKVTFHSNIKNIKIQKVYRKMIIIFLEINIWAYMYIIYIYIYENGLGYLDIIREFFNVIRKEVLRVARTQDIRYRLVEN